MKTYTLKIKECVQEQEDGKEKTIGWLACIEQRTEENGDIAYNWNYWESDITPTETRAEAVGQMKMQEIAQDNQVEKIVTK